MADVLDRWRIVGASDPDAKGASAFLLEDDRGALRILDVSAGIAFPPSYPSSLRSEHWYTPKGELDLAALSRHVEWCDNSSALERALKRGRADSALSASRVRERLGLAADERIAEFTRHEELFSEGDLTFQRLVERIRAAKGSVSIVVYVRPEQSLSAPDRWLRAPRPRSFWSSIRNSLISSNRDQESRNRCILQSDDHLRFAFAAPPSSFDFTHAVRSIEAHPLWSCDAQKGILDANDRQGRYTLHSSFSDLVLFSGFEDLVDLPHDIWTTRSQALLVPARGPAAPLLLKAIRPFSGPAVFLADEASDRLWQHFTRSPNLARLRTCLVNLVRLYRDRSASIDEVQQQATAFLRSVYVSPEVTARSDEVRELLTHDALQGLDLPMPEQVT